MQNTQEGSGAYLWIIAKSYTAILQDFLLRVFAETAMDVKITNGAHPAEKRHGRSKTVSSISIV